mgnify:CR=1 FL=1
MKKYLFHGVFCLSGIAGLGYEILWTRMLTVSLGHEIISMLGVVSAFFAGIALGAVVPASWQLGFSIPLMFLALLAPVISPQERIAQTIGLPSGQVIARGWFSADMKRALKEIRVRTT